MSELELSYKLLEEKIVHLKEIHQIEKGGLEKALELQAREYERRLEILNGEARKLHSMQETYVGREIFEEFKKQVEQNGKDISDNLHKVESWQATKNGRDAVFYIMFVIVMFLLNYFKK